MRGTQRRDGRERTPIKGDHWAQLAARKQHVTTKRQRHCRDIERDGLGERGRRSAELTSAVNIASFMLDGTSHFRLTVTLNNEKEHLIFDREHNLFIKSYLEEKYSFRSYEQSFAFLHPVT